MNDAARSQIDSSPRISGVTRRSLVKGAAWSVPAISLAVAMPAAAASPTDIGAFSLDGSCGVLGILGPGFVLSAPTDAAIPIGTTIDISSTGLANIGVIRVTDSVTEEGLARVDVLSPTTRRITITRAVPEGRAIGFGTALSLGLLWRLNATAELPADYTGTGAKSSGEVRVLAVVGCRAS